MPRLLFPYIVFSYCSLVLCLGDGILIDYQPRCAGYGSAQSPLCFIFLLWDMTEIFTPFGLFNSALGCGI